MSDTHVSSVPVYQYRTLNVRFAESVCFIQLHRPEANNAITDELIAECRTALRLCESSVNAVVIEGLPETFCFGMDFNEVRRAKGTDEDRALVPEMLYELWNALAYGPYVTIAHVRGKANAGGIGFVAACDIVLADETAHFSLSELLFGLFPACVFPFLIRRIGVARAHYLTLLTTPIDVREAHGWGLVDAYQARSDDLVRKQLLRVKRLSKPALRRYKQYLAELDDSVARSKASALRANREMMSDPGNIAGIARYVDKGVFPWEP